MYQATGTVRGKCPHNKLRTKYQVLATGQLVGRELGMECFGDAVPFRSRSA